MKPLIVLIVVFVLSLFATWLAQGSVNELFSGNLAMSVMLIFTAFAHFKFKEGMAMMLPEFVPYKKALVVITGYIEIIAAIGLMISSVRVLTGWLLIVFFICILPANISAAMRNIDYMNTSNKGSGSRYLWFRVPLQVFFIAWIWWFSIKGGTVF